jgi:hypothetical protein
VNFSVLAKIAVMFQALFVAVGVLWTATYLLIIQRGFRDRTYGMPAAALCANVSWEILYAFVWPQSAPEVAVNVTWLLFDLVLIGQFLRFAPAEHPDVPRALLYGGFALGLATAFPIVLLICRDLNQGRGGYAAFGMDLMMSILFVAMLRRRGSVRGQSLWIAATKTTGSALAGFTAWHGGRIPPGTALMPFLIVANLAWNCVYTSLLWRTARRDGVPLWRL